MTDRITLPVPLFEFGHYQIMFQCDECNRKFIIASLQKKDPAFCIYCSSRNGHVSHVYKEEEFKPCRCSTECECGLIYLFLEKDAEALCIRCNIDLKYGMHHASPQLEKRQAEAAAD